MKHTPENLTLNLLKYLHQMSVICLRHLQSIMCVNPGLISKKDEISLFSEKNIVRHTANDAIVSGTFCICTL